MQEEANPDDIIIVDDDPANLKLLQIVLERNGYKVSTFNKGSGALRAAKEDPPDLILLDVNMPEMNGYEVCRRLKADASTKEVPVIFISGLGEAIDKVAAFQAGGADYVTKPFEFEEVRARIDTHLKLRRNQLALLKYNEHLEELVRQRSEELAAAHRRLSILDQAKSDFLKLISHELRTPLNGLLGVSQLILEECESNSSVDEFRELFDSAKDTILNIIDDALLLAQVEVSADSFHLVPVEIDPILHTAADLTAAFASSRNASLQISGDSDLMVLADQDLLGKALTAILKTALKLCYPGQAVQVNCSQEAGCAIITIEFMGQKIPDEALTRFFEVFSVCKRITHDCDLGLAPPLAERIVSLLGGSLIIRNRVPEGVAFELRISKA